MDLSLLVEQLTADDPGQRSAAAEALVSAGASAVEPLLAAVHERYHGHDVRPYLTTLGRIGDAAFWPVVRAIDQAESWSHVVHAGMALEGLRVDDPQLYVHALRHPNPAVRNRVLVALEDQGGAALPHAAAILPLIADPDEHVQGRAVMALKSMAPAVLPVLRDIRRSADPYRRQALIALAETGGWSALDPADQRLIRRLIDVKLTAEKPWPMDLCGYWFALRTDDQDAVLAEFGLSDPMPVTMRLGEWAWGLGLHGEPPNGAWVYVSPVLDGWTLVFGEPSPDIELGALKSFSQCVEALSRRFGEAHWYQVFEGATAWILGENGRIVRSFDSERPDEQTGPPHPAENGYLLPYEDVLEDTLPEDAFDDVKQELDIPDECDATHIAARASVDPSSVGRHTTMRGHGVLALTAIGRREGTPPGVLPI